MKIRQKLLLSYLLLVVLFIAAGVAVALNTMKMADLQANVKKQVEINDNAYAYQQGLDQKQFGTLVYCTRDNVTGTNIIVSSSEKMYQAETYLLDALRNSPDLLAKFNQVTALDRGQINDAITQATNIADSDSNSTDKFVSLWNQLDSLNVGLTQADAQLADVRNATLTDVQNSTVASQNYANMSNIINIAFIAVISAVSVALAFVMGKRITDPLKKLADIAHKVSLGDLNQRHYLSQNVDVKTGDEIDDLVDAFKRMINAFRMVEALTKEGEATDKP
jgi:nitrogen fixation/metabolism regulation signal transduction histidine kinase